MVSLPKESGRPPSEEEILTYFVDVDVFKSFGVSHLQVCVRVWMSLSHLQIGSIIGSLLGHTIEAAMLQLEARAFEIAREHPCAEMLVWN